MKSQRISALQTSMDSRGIDIMVLIPGPNLYYFSGIKMHTSERPTMFFVSRQAADGSVFLPNLEVPNASSILGSDYALYAWTDEEGPEDKFKSLCIDLQLEGKKVAVEFLRMRVMELELLKRYAPDTVYVDGESLIAELRMCKDSEEIACMRKAAEITEKALQATVEMIRPGVTEYEVASQLKIQGFINGSGELPKEPIVSSGPRTASPHTKTSRRAIEAGDLVMIDTGASYEGYACDLTRTFAVGNIDDELKKIYEIVKDANQAVIRYWKSGVRAEELDQVARDVIEAAGYGQFFIHRLGHGLGLEGHEPPYMVRGNKLIMQSGMTFTDEPGIYLPGKGGVRIEDDVVVTDSGLEYLTSYPRELSIL